MVGPHDRVPSRADSQRAGISWSSVADAEALAEWLVTNVTQSERSGERVREQLMVRCRDERIEPPTSGRIDRIIRSALSRGEDVLFAQVSGRLSVEVRSRMLALIAAGDMTRRAIRRCWRRFVRMWATSV